MSSSVFFYEPFYDIDRFFDAFSPLANNQNGRTRRTVENDDATFELPGLKKEDVNIDLRDGRLTISAETKLSDEHERSGYAVRERRFGKVSRTLQLPQGVKEEEIKATMENGVLTVTFPKTAQEQAPRKITIA